jgi:DNA-binding MarR family transcriptional regulator
MAQPTENPSVGYLLWRLTTRLRAAVDRELAPLGLTHAQYTLLASLYGFSQNGTLPSQRELADWTGLEPIFVSKLARALEHAALIERAEHPADTRAVQLRITDHGVAIAERAIAIVQALQEELTQPIGGIQSRRSRALVRTLSTLLDTQHRRESMTSAPTLTGQDVGAAEGALTGLLERILAGSNTGLSRTTYITLRLLALGGPARTPESFPTYLSSQPQLGLDRQQAVELLRDLERRGLITGSAADGHDPIQLTASGAALHATVADAVMAVMRRLYGDMDPDDLATTHNILVEVTQRAARLREEL